MYNLLLVWRKTPFNQIHTFVCHHSALRGIGTQDIHGKMLHRPIGYHIHLQWMSPLCGDFRAPHTRLHPVKSLLCFLQHLCHSKVPTSCSSTRMEGSISICIQLSTPFPATFILNISDNATLGTQALKGCARTMGA